MMTKVFIDLNDLKEDPKMLDGKFIAKVYKNEKDGHDNGFLSVTINLLHYNVSNLQVYSWGNSAMTLQRKSSDDITRFEESTRRIELGL